MSTDQPGDEQQRRDVAAVRSLAEEVEATEDAVREHGGGALPAADRVALDAAKRLVRTVRHRAEAEGSELDERTGDFTEHAFEHKAQEGGGFR